MTALALAAFWDLLPLSRAVFDLPPRLRSSRTRGGSLLQSFDGAMFWKGSAELVPLEHAGSIEFEALLRLLRMRGTFLAYDIRKPYPAADPGGILLGSAAPKIASKGSDNVSIAIEDLPDSYPLTFGDMVSFPLSSGRLALHQLVESATAAVGGTTPEFDVVPPLRSGTAVGAAVTLVKACGEFRIPDGFSPPTAVGPISDGISFAFEEAL